MEFHYFLYPSIPPLLYSMTRSAFIFYHFTLGVCSPSLSSLHMPSPKKYQNAFSQFFPETLFYTLTYLYTRATCIALCHPHGVHTIFSFRMEQLNFLLFLLSVETLSPLSHVRNENFILSFFISFYCIVGTIFLSLSLECFGWVMQN